MNALLFLYRNVLQKDLAIPIHALRAKPSEHLLNLDPSGLQPAVRATAKLANVDKPVSPHTFRYCIATHLLEAGYDIRTVQELLGHKDVKTTMINTHMLNRGPKVMRSLLD